MTSRFKIADEVYEYASADDVTLRDLLMIEPETEQMGHAVNMGEVVRLAELFKSLTPDEAKVHPEGGWMLSITVWMSMVKKLRDSGDYTTLVPFANAIDFRLSEFKQIADPKDRQASSGKAPKKAARKTASRPAIADAAAAPEVSQD